MPHRFKAILFDLDGTIIDSLYDLQKAINGLLYTENRRGLTLEEMRACTGDGLRIMIGKAYATTGTPLSEADIATRMPRYLEIYAGITPQPSCIYEGMLDFIKKQKTDGIKLGLCTNKHESSTLSIMRALALDTYFDVMIGGDTLPEKKPHPLPLQHALKTLGIHTGDAVMIGDSPNDTMAATAAGILSIRASYGYTPDWPNDVPYTAQIDTPRGLEAVLKTL